MGDVVPFKVYTNTNTDSKTLEQHLESMRKVLEPYLKQKTYCVFSVIFLQAENPNEVDRLIVTSREVPNDHIKFAFERAVEELNRQEILEWFLSKG